MNKPKKTTAIKKYDVNGNAMNGTIMGRGPNIILVHGFTDSIGVRRYSLPASATGWFGAAGENNKHLN